MPTSIEWTDETWNPVTGCTKVSAGCKHCYAERLWPRMSAPGQPYEGRSFQDVACHPERLEQPFRWRKPRRIFVNSMSDLFHESVPFDFIAAVFCVMAANPRHEFQVLTKRPERMQAFFAWVDDYRRDHALIPGLEARESAVFKRFLGKWTGWKRLPMVRWKNQKERLQWEWPFRNVWLGVSVENESAAVERIPPLLQTPAARRFVSVEPLLGPVDLSPWLAGGESMQMVIVGGESGPRARPMHPEWARLLRDQCASARVPFFFKQWGEWAECKRFDAPAESVVLLDGRVLDPDEAIPLMSASEQRLLDVKPSV